MGASRSKTTGNRLIKYDETMKTILKLIVSLLLAAVIGGMIASASGLPAGLVVTAFITLSFVPKVEGVIATSLDITELNTKLGAYFRKDKATLIGKMLLGLDINDRMDVWDDCKDQVPLPNLVVGDIVKPANNSTFAPTAGALSFGSRILQVRPWKADLQIIPADLNKSWLGKYKKKGSDVYDMPFEQYIMNEIIKKVRHQLRTTSLFSGVYNAGGATATDIMNGVKKIIADEITATNITPVVTGAVTAANVIDKVELVYDNLGEAVKRGDTQLLVSPQIFAWYVRKYRELYGANGDYSGMAKFQVPLDGTNCMIKSEPGLAASQRMICTTTDNITFGVDSLADDSNINSQVFERTIKLMIDAKAGVEFKDIDSDVLAVNDQA